MISLKSSYQPLLELRRGDLVESIHYGAIAIADGHGNLIGSFGNPQVVTFLRSSAKPFQALPLLESKADEFYGFTSQEISLICSSHSGTDEHVAVLTSLQSKAGISEDQLLCGVHPPMDEKTADALKLLGQNPTSNRHNCSGKHTGMLIFSKYSGISSPEYISLDHPLQKQILTSFAGMAELPIDQVILGIDGCSAPNFAIPLHNAAQAFARLCDPTELSKPRAQACRKITTAMMAYPIMVAGRERFDTCIMETLPGRIVSKGGAEGYQAIGLMPDALFPGSPALGIAIKIADGDLNGRARPAITLEVLRQIGAISQNELENLQGFEPVKPLKNWRQKVVGVSQPCFKLDIHPELFRRE